ncbi:hypothetical protein HJC23_005624 [Cyclotella cryptica]|uniref:Peroxin-14 n=1 Tax=Cyclotella cryptica TaxID=29204 RepID=A0ABD3PYN9_9STRA|eukprot:CCRYP_010493-RA/>CCRYP_010493-RA protein AED:0.13 eAED:0.13 QI:158/1/1/1/0/0/2/2214/671
MMETPRSDQAPTATALSSDAKRADANIADADGLTKTSPSLSIDEERIQKAESFLRNGEIENVSVSAKRDFLEKKAGMSSHEVDAAMKRVAKRGELDRFDENRDYERRGSDDRYRSGEIDSYGHGRDIQRRYQDDRLDDRDSYRNRHERDYRMDDRRGQVYEPTLQHSQPRYYDSNTMNPPYAQGVSPDQIEEQQRSRSSEFSLFSWAGGFSLGVVCLAALRWLNGGDFVLFPPPSVSDSIRLQRRHIQKDNRSDGNDAEETSDTNDQEEDITPLLEHVLEGSEEEEEADSELDDEALQSILNGTANAHNLHPGENQPSYEDLVLEIRALASAVHSYREEQERANRATAAKVGRGMTDDVMDLLREDKKNKDEAKLPAKGTENVDASTIRSLLKDLSDDLTQLKLSLSKSNERKNSDVDNGGISETIGSEPVESTCGDEERSSETDLLTILNSSMEKLQKVIDVIEVPQGDQIDNKDTFVVAEGTGSRPSQLPQPIEETNSLTTGESVEDSLLPQSAPVETEPSSETEPNTHDVERALKTLSSTNGDNELRVGAQMLYLYCMNISKNPTIPRYRKIYTNNSTFQKKVGSLNGAKELLSAVGFVEGTNFFEWGGSSDTSMDTEASLDLALVALDMMRKGTKTVEETSNQTLLEEHSDPNETTLPGSAATSSSD